MTLFEEHDIFICRRASIKSREQMKSIRYYNADKYLDSGYQLVEPNVYRHGDRYVVSLSFIQEPELGEGENASDISQYPLEDIIEKYYVYISDFYPELNKKDSNICVLEFCSDKIERIRVLMEIVGRHIYNLVEEQNGVKYARLMID